MGEWKLENRKWKAWLPVGACDEQAKMSNNKIHFPFSTNYFLHLEVYDGGLDPFKGIGTGYFTGQMDGDTFQRGKAAGFRLVSLRRSAPR